MAATKLFAIFPIFLLLKQGLSSDLEQRCDFNLPPPMARSMTCKYVTNVAKLEEDIKNANRNNVKQLILQDSSINFFPHGSFRNTKFAMILLYNSTILSLSDTTTAFEGLEDHLRSLFIEHIPSVRLWDWNQLRNLRNLKQLAVTDSGFPVIPEAIGSVSRDSLQIIDFDRNRINQIHEKAFAELRNLKLLSLVKNNIESLKRSMFPRPSKIVVVDFSHNKLKNLDGDIFDDMPLLRTIKFIGNQLQTMDERIFDRLWNQLDECNFKENPLRCDCHLMWLTKHRSEPRITIGYCDSPLDLKGHRINELTSNDLLC